jgi:hypothetical protein
MHATSTRRVSPEGSFKQRVIALFGHQLGRSARRAHHLRALAGTELDVVHRGAGGNVLERQRIADQDVRLGPTHDRLPYLQADRLNDVALFAVQIIHQRDARGAVGIVLDRGHFAGHAELVPLEVDQAQLLLMATAMVTDGQIAGIAAAARALLDCQQRLVGRFVVMSSFTRVVWKRSVGVIGLYVLIGIFFF